jgi:hypothetical protein
VFDPARGAGAHQGVHQLLEECSVDYPKSVPSVGLVDGKFVDENTATGVVGSLIPSKWGNSLTDEILNVIKSAGVEPDEASTEQLLYAVKVIVQGSAPSFSIDTGTSSAYVAAYTPPVKGLIEGLTLKFKAKNTNSGVCTFSPNGLAAKPIVGGANLVLQGGEIAADADVLVQYNGSVAGGSWVILNSPGGAVQIAPATKSRHALQLGQATGRLIGLQTFTSNATYTPTAGTKTAIARLIGGGGAGGGAAATSSSQISVGGGGGSGSYLEIGIDSPSAMPVTIGAGGIGAVGGSGAAGGTTILGTVASAPGGGQGNSVLITSTTSNGGAPGLAGQMPTTSATLLASSRGSPGGLGIAQNAFTWGGNGGSAAYGGGAIGSGSGAGIDGASAGAGGSGAAATPNSNTAVSGGNGARGIIIIEEYS